MEIASVYLTNGEKFEIIFDEYSYDIDENTLTFFYEGNISAVFKLEFLICFVVGIEDEQKGIVL